MTPPPSSPHVRPKLTVPLTTAGGRPIAVVHLTAEYTPYARTGGLAEAVNGLTLYQKRMGVRALAIMPLYHSVREQGVYLEPVGEPFTVRVGAREETARIYHTPRDFSDPEVYFIEHEGYFGRAGLYGEAGQDYPDNAHRFAFFCHAALAAIPRLVAAPLVLHAHDWHAALAPLLLRTTAAVEPWTRDTCTVLSVHNPGYQGYFPAEVVPDLGVPAETFNWQHLEWYGQANFLKGGLTFSDFVVTVSPTHAEELKTPGGGFGLDGVFRGLGNRLLGIINGIDQQHWTPALDEEIPARYTADDFSGKAVCKAELQRAFKLPVRPTVPLFGFTGRLAGQKGLDLILGARALLNLDAQFVFLGQGDPRYAQALTELARHAPDRVGVELKFTDRMEHRLIAGCDLFMMPSQYEPCGLTQMRAQRYGSPPVARRVGGLADTISDTVTGFLFDAYTPEAFQGAAFWALEHFATPSRWLPIMRAGMARDFSWERSAERYLDVYRQAVALAHMTD